MKRITIISALIAVSGLIFVFPWYYLFQWAPQLLPLSISKLLVIWICPIALFIIWAKLHTPASAVLGYLSVNWLGICFMFMLATALTFGLRIVFTITDTNCAITQLVLGCALCLYAIYKASNLKITHQTLSSKKLSKSYKIAHLSDIHLGSRSLRFLSKIIEKTNHLEPDLVFITGDLIDMSHVKPEALKTLSQFSAPVFFITGNHDRYIGSSDHFKMIDESGVLTLNNTDHTYHDLQIIGIADSLDPKQLKLKLSDISIDTEKFSILLYHKPENFSIAVNRQIDLMLCGHTHGGQIFPFNYIVKKQFPHLKGMFKSGSSRLFVSQGTGTWGPVMRLGTHNEIVVIDLICSNEMK